MMSRRRGHEGDLDVVVARQLADRGVGTHPGEVCLRGFPALQVRVDDRDELEPLGTRHAHAVVVAHPPEGTVAHDPDPDVAPAAVQIGAERAAEELDEAGRPERVVGVAKAAGDHPAGAQRGFDDGREVPEGHAHVDDDLAVGQRDEGHEPIDHGELARHTVGDVGVRGGDPRVVLAGLRLRPGDYSQKVGPEPIALGRHPADGHQRRTTLDGRAQRRQGRERLRRLRSVDDDGVVLGHIRERLPGANESELAEALGEGSEGRCAIVREAGGQDEDAHGPVTVSQARPRRPQSATDGRRRSAMMSMVWWIAG
jgi:hypothetical protein